MSGQLINEGFSNILPSTHSAVIPGLLMSAFYLAFKPPNTERNPPNAKELKGEYDFIIVGAGSAGAVVANRLSENPDFHVLLLEAGGGETAITDTPALSRLSHRSEKDWNFTTESSTKFCLSTMEEGCPYVQGRILGGSSALNGMVYVRGNKRDYDDWAAAGNYGWGYEDVLPYFKKSENNTNLNLAKNKRYHSTKGELTVSDPRWQTPFSDNFLKAGRELGYFNEDYNAENQTGFTKIQFTIRDGYRCSTNKAFLLPAGKRENLDIAQHSHVTKVLIDPVTSRAYGVRFFRYGQYHEVLARKEVILSAGAFNTPKLLMLSGIGPKDHLQKLNIALVKDLPVGFNLQDHVGVMMSFETDQPVTSDPEKYSTLAKMTYEVFQTGPLSTPGIDVMAFVNSKFQDVTDSRPDLQLFLLSNNPFSNENRTREQPQSTTEPNETSSHPTLNKQRFNILLILLRVQSRGRVLLKNDNPFEKPVLRMNYFDKEEDVERLAEGGRIALKIINTKAFKSVNARFLNISIPLCPKALSPSDEYFECLMRYNAAPGIHAVGTAKMGPNSDKSSVLDPELRVHGISGLRVIDASVMPSVVSGNTNAPTIMIGEKGSDLIKNTWENRRSQTG